MRTLSVIAALGLTVAPCGGANPDDVVATVTSATSHSVATADTTTTTLSPSTPGAPNMPLLADRSTLTVADAGRSYTTTLGNRIEHQLSSDYLWSGPRIEGPAQLIEINFVADPSFMAWEVLIEGKAR